MSGSVDLQEARNIVIIGGGIIGCTTAYYLTRHPYFSSQTSITVIEASEYGPAQGASGKAGGLVARWAYPKELVDVSFDEHVKLAAEHNGGDRWGWRYVDCGRWEGRGQNLLNRKDSGSGVGEGGKKKSLEKTLGLDEKKKSRKKTGLPDDLMWVEEELTDSYTPMAGDKETAQVHPYLFTTSMWDLASAKGAVLLKGKVTSIQKTDGRVTGVDYVEGGTHEAMRLSATHVVLAAGAWSSSLLPSLPITGTRAHSVTIRPKPTVDISPYVLFTEISLPLSASQRRTVDPEIYARPDGEVYACGPGDDSPLPATVDGVIVDESACNSVYMHASSISQALRQGTVEKRQACFLPSVSVGGGPIIGDARHIAKGLVIATGHTCWGISNAPGTARVLCEIIMDGTARSVNLRKMQPSIFV
ncbi:FAD dependent oxidoreductase [Collybia nuda]|uniref:FAD dependent oxidoreductase n=1 Tax=Collybia nuda TaxID=64659 RepID=A0A9P5Y6U5_9AGAR|nr:FAD dependent oxidoreductase [Collybia nuda]